MGTRIFMDKNQRNIRDEVVDSYSSVLKSTGDLHGNPNNVIGYAVYALSDLSGVPVGTAIDYVTEAIFAGHSADIQRRIAGGIVAFAIAEPDEYIQAIFENYKSFVQEEPVPSFDMLERNSFDFLGDHDVRADMIKASRMGEAGRKSLQNLLYASGGDIGFSGDTSTGDKDGHGYTATHFDQA